MVYFVRGGKSLRELGVVRIVSCSARPLPRELVAAPADETFSTTNKNMYFFLKLVTNTASRAIYKSFLSCVEISRFHVNMNVGVNLKDISYDFRTVQDLITHP